MFSFLCSCSILSVSSFFFLFYYPSTTEIYTYRHTLSLPVALPISCRLCAAGLRLGTRTRRGGARDPGRSRGACRQGTHGGHVLPRSEPRRISVCRTGPKRQGRRALVHHRSNETAQRDRGRQGGGHQGNPGRKRRTGRIWSTLVCDWLTTCSRKF